MLFRSLFRMAPPSGPCAFEELANSSFVFSKLQPSLLRDWYAKAIRPGSAFLFRMAPPSGPCAFEELPSMLLKRWWVLLLDRCAALASKFLTRMDPRPWPGPRLTKNLAQPQVYTSLHRIKNLRGNYTLGSDERASFRQGRSRKGTARRLAKLSLRPGWQTTKIDRLHRGINPEFFAPATGGRRSCWLRGVEPRPELRGAADNCRNGARFR